MIEGNARACITAVLVIALTAGGPIEAAYLQAGYDAARTGNSPDDGPDRPEVAWRVKLPGSRAEGAAPLVLDGYVYVATSNGTDQKYRWEGQFINTAPLAAGLDTNGVFRIRVDTGASELLATLPSSPFGMASDGTSLYVTTYRHGIQAFDMASRAARWQWPYPVTPVTGDYETRCQHLAISAGVLYVACTQDWNGDAPINEATLGGVVEKYHTFAAALNASTGAEKWVSFNALGGGFPTPETPRESRTATTSSACEEVTGLSVIPPYLLITARETESEVAAYRSFLRVLRASEGVEIWSKNSEVYRGSTQTSDFATCTTTGPRLPSPTGLPTVFFAKVERRLFALGPSAGEEIWSREIGVEDELKDDYGSGFAFDGDWLYATSAQTISKINATTQTLAWSRTLDPESGERWGRFSLLLANGTIYAGSVSPSGSGLVLRAYDSMDGSQLFGHRMEHGFVTPINESNLMFAVGEGMIPIAGLDGSVTLLGRTAASIKPVLAASSVYPAPGEAVNVSMEGTVAGSQGAATEFRVDWGDGGGTDWVASPRFRHNYATPGNYAAAFWARNDAGQASAEDVIFHVGALDPSLTAGEKQDSARKVVETAAAPENQNLVFFVVGLALTGAGAAVGAWALRRKRNRLRQELRAVENIYEQAKRDPPRTEAAMRERRDHARAMFEGRKLDEAQLETLSRRIDELSRQSRLDVLDEKYRFLPYGIIVMLRGMLEDNRLSAIDRANAVAAIDREEGLTTGQKEQARHLVEEWFRRDSVSPGPPRQ